MHFRPSSNTLIAASLVAAAIVMSFVAWTLTATLRASEEAAARVHHSEEVLAALGSFRESFATISAAQRGYLLDGRPSFLQQREQAITEAGEAVARMRELTRDNPAQQERARNLELLLAERAANTRSLAKRLRPVLPSTAVPQQEMERIRQVSGQVAALASQLQGEEDRLLHERQDIEADRQRRNLLLLAASFVGFALMVMLAYGTAMLEARRRRRSERQMTAMVEDLPATVWQMRTGLDGQRRFIYVGSGAFRERGLHAEELMRNQALAMESVAEEDRERVAEALKLSEDTLAPLDVSYRVPAREGAPERWVHKHARLRRMPDGSVLWTGYWTDITEHHKMDQALRDATEEARRASRAKSTFLATMSHEIRTPMTGVMGLLELLGLSRMDGEQRATLGVIRESSKSLLRIIDDILDFSKVEEGQLSLDPEPASLRDVVRRACEVHSGTAASKGLELEYSIDNQVGPAHVFDPLRLGQILHNFLSNAVKFTEQGGVHVQVELLARHEDAEDIRITVMDTGIGVAPETVAQLFQPFAQATPRVAARYGGTGLGLAICRSLAQLMGGNVQMRSTPGKGTQMLLDVRFPIADPTAVAQAAAAPEAAQRRLHATLLARRPAPQAEQAEAEGTLVLVVDDHPTNRLVLSRQVATLGYGVLLAEDGLQALALWQSRRIGLVLTDSNMPQMNGYELARNIRRIEEAGSRPRTPILACTANALDNEAARCAAAGMDGCLFKPASLPELLLLLETWLPLPDGAGHALPAQDADGQSLPFDRALLELVTGGDREMERRILTDFLQATAQDLAQLQAAAETYDTRELARLAHRMLGAAQTLGATSLQRACRALEENAIVAEPQANLVADLDRLKAHARTLEAELRTHMDAPSLS